MQRGNIKAESEKLARPQYTQRWIKSLFHPIQYGLHQQFSFVWTLDITWKLNSGIRQHINLGVTDQNLTLKQAKHICFKQNVRH